MNSKFAKKRSSSTCSQIKRTKFAAMPDAGINPKEVHTTPQGEPAPMSPLDVNSSTDAFHEEIPSSDWLTAICQSLGEVPALYESSAIHPTPVIDLTAEIPWVLTPTPTPSACAPYHPTDEATARKSAEVLREWDLDDGLTVSLHRSEWKLHVHIRKNSQLIIMTIPTYCDFKNQLAKVGKPFERPSIICNNQLAVFSYTDKLILQQIFHFEHFKLKNHSLELYSIDESRLEYAFKHIDDTIKVSIFESVLLNQLTTKMTFKKPTYDQSDLLHEFMLVVNEEISRHVNALFVCYGCKMSSPGQRSHDCLNVDYKDQCSIVGEESILLIDPRRIANVLREKGILYHFNQEFFRLHKYDEIRSLMEM